MRPILLSYSTSGRLFDEGGEKLHVFDWTVGRVLCGRHLVGSCLEEVTLERLQEADASGRICRQCLKKARRVLGDYHK